MDWWIVVMCAIELAFIAAVVWAVAWFRLNRQRQRSEERIKLLDRFSSAEQLSQFLTSEPGASFAALFAVPRRQPLRTVSVVTAVGVVLLFLGGGFLVLAGLEVFGDADVFLIPGVLGIGAGIGALVAMRLSVSLIRRWSLDRSDD